MGEQASRLQIEVLGPLRVRDATGRDLTPDGSLQRRLLALLLVHRGLTVSVDAAVDALWPQEPPDNPAAALHNHVSRLRRALPAELIERTADGYRLDPSGIDVDADRLVEVTRPGSDPGPDHFAELDAVLARWHGPAYPDLVDVDDGRAEAARLEELRTRALEDRAEHRLHRGDTEGLVAELAALAEADPLRERPCHLLMDALAASGRRVEALRVYDDYRRVLGDELGIEPSAVLTARHAELLAGEVSGHATQAWAPPTRLPSPITSLVGRAELLDELLTSTIDDRMITLVGPGGVGKTRLLLELGRRVQERHDGRPVVLCLLAETTERGAVDAVATSLGIDARPGADPIDRICSVVGDTAATVLLDNCEHLLTPVARLAEALLARCPGVTLAATSRERLRVPGERVHVVPTLGTSETDADAIELFVARAQTADPGFDPEAADLALVREIVRHLDGLPLAIELAAARLHTHDLDEVAAGLEQRFGLLTSGHRTSPRHESLAATVSWSFDLLDPGLRRTFAALSVFTSPFDVADAAAVCGLDPATARSALAHLTERSMVLRTRDRRFVLLETLRAFAAEQLAASEDGHDARHRHARHFVEWAEEARCGFVDPRQCPIAEIDARVGELRVALDWLLDHDEPHLAGRLVTALYDYAFFRLRPDVLAWAEALIDGPSADRLDEVGPAVLVVAAYAAWMSGDGAEAVRRADRARRANEALATGDSTWVEAALGLCALVDGRLGEAAERYRRSAELAGRHTAWWWESKASELLALGYAGDPAGRALAAELRTELGDTATPHAAYAWYCIGEAALDVAVTEARAAFTRALEIAGPLGNSFVTGLAGASRASIEVRVGDPEVAAAEYRWLLPHWRSAGMWATQWTMLRSTAGLLERLGRPTEAAVLEGAVRAAEGGHRIFGADAVALDELGRRLRDVLGDDAYEAACEAGRALDGDAAVEHALRSL